MAIETKIGVYVCSGCDIGKSIHCNKIAESLQSETKVAFCKVNDWLCGEKAIQGINSNIDSEGLNRIVIGACSPRYLTDIFKFDSKKVMWDRANLREHVAWCHTPFDVETDTLALDYLKMGVAKMQNSDFPEPMILDINETVLVVGGGVTGMNAALASAKAGYPVVIAEKEAELGGFYKKLYKLTKSQSPNLDLHPNLCSELAAQVESEPNIQVLKSTNIDKISGQPGLFNVTARSNGTTHQFQVGSIIQATGWKPYNPNKLGHLGYGRIKNVVTNIELEELAKNNTLKKPSDGGDIKSILFIQCAGSRDQEHLPYCSSVCCMASLKQALYIREKYPDANIYVIYKDIRTPGQNEIFYKRVQNEENIFLTKGEIVAVEESDSGEILVDIDETLIGEKIQIATDMVVLATGLVPSTKVDIEEENVAGEGGTLDGKKAAAGAEAGAKILNLSYRQGTDLPTLHYGFPDSHYICFPYETRRTGIYAAGTVRSPMDTVACKSDALGSAMKAIQVIENTRKGTTVHPRSGDTTFPDFFMQRCTQCKRCTEECPFGTLDEDDKGTPQPNPNRCRRCGICMGACPERIISFKNYSVHIISTMIKAIEMPPSEDERPRIIAFLCENDAYPSLDIAGRKKMFYSPNIRVIPVRCLGSVNTSWIADALSAGFDGAILIGCKYGDDYQCHFIRGSELANTRMENVQEKLKQLVLEPERVEIHTLSIDEYDKIPGIFNKFAEVIDRVGPNPYKDM